MEKVNVNLQDVEFESYMPQIQTCVNCYCGLCVAYCPALEETKDESLSARGLSQIMQGIKRGEFDFEELPDEVIYACTGCRWCEWNCSQNTPLWITQHGDRTTKVSGSTMTELMRSIRVEKGEVPKAVKDALDSIVKFGNPYGRPKQIKDKWVEDLGCTFSGEDTLLYVGSIVPYEDRSTKMAEALIEILKKANLTFSMIGGDESDSGALARYMGEEGLFEELVEKEARLFKEKGIKKIICLSPHDYNDFMSYYGFNDIEFKHYTEVLLEIIKDKKIELTKEVKKRVTYHDPCYLGRKLNIYDPPREILKGIPGLELVEMDRNKEMAYCCGGGGTGLWYELPRIHMNYTRVDHAKEKNVDYLAVACPVCLQMLDDGVKSRDYDIPVKDIAQIVMEAV
ncbi:MAG: (Fe-S)-binding protein [Desulfobacteraceae bacterium]|nr:(Fe-S)-binding protein [Desulfobacteraceae bacterium]